MFNVTMLFVIFQALLVFRKEQNCSRRPGDVYHPDFMDGRPGYFDVTIGNSLLPSYILKAAISPGAAAKVAECEKMPGMKSVLLQQVVYSIHY